MGFPFMPLALGQTVSAPSGEPELPELFPYPALTGSTWTLGGVEPNTFTFDGDTLDTPGGGDPLDAGTADLNEGKVALIAALTTTESYDVFCMGTLDTTNGNGSVRLRGGTYVNLVDLGSGRFGATCVAGSSGTSGLTFRSQGAAINITDVSVKEAA